MGPSTATKCISLQNKRLQSTLLKRLIPKNYFRVTVVNYTMQYTEYVNESRFPARSTRHDHVGSRAMANSRVLAREQGDQRLVVARTSSAASMPTPSPMVHSISPILIWLPASRRTRRSASPIPPLSVARVQRATPTLRRYRPKTRLRRHTQVGSPRASRRMSCPGARRGRGARR